MCIRDRGEAGRPSRRPRTARDRKGNGRVRRAGVVRVEGVQVELDGGTGAAPGGVVDVGEGERVLGGVAEVDVPVVEPGAVVGAAEARGRPRAGPGGRLALEPAPAAAPERGGVEHHRGVRLPRQGERVDVGDVGLGVGLGARGEDGEHVLGAAEDARVDPYARGGHGAPARAGVREGDVHRRRTVLRAQAQLDVRVLRRAGAGLVVADGDGVGAVAEVGVPPLGPGTVRHVLEDAARELQGQRTVAGRRGVGRGEGGQGRDRGGRGEVLGRELVPVEVRHPLPPRRGVEHERRARRVQQGPRVGDGRPDRGVVLPAAGPRQGDGGDDRAVGVTGVDVDAARFRGRRLRVGVAHGHAARGDPAEVEAGVLLPGALGDAAEVAVRVVRLLHQARTLHPVRVLGLEDGVTALVQVSASIADRSASCAAMSVPVGESGSARTVRARSSAVRNRP